MFRRPRSHPNPHPSCRRARLPPIDNVQLLKLKIDMVEALGNIEMSNRVIDTGKGTAFDMHPIDAKQAPHRAARPPAAPPHHRTPHRLMLSVPRLGRATPPHS
eukprot:2274140-Prymnesium_polylepis.1